MRATDFLTRLALVSVLAVAIALAGCGGGGDSSGNGGGTITVSGHVVDDGSLTFVQGARVVASTGQETTTDASGSFDLTGLPDSVSSVTVTKSGYTSTAVAVSAGSGDRSVGIVYLPPALLAGNGKVTGLVTSAGSGVGGAVITAVGASATSHSDGTFTLYNVPAGACTVSARSADGLSGGSANTTVVAGTSVSVSIALTTQPPPPPPI